MNLEKFLELPDLERAKVIREIEAGNMKPSQYPGKVEYRNFQKDKLAYNTLHRLEHRICPFCGRSGAIGIKPRPMGKGLGQRDETISVEMGNYWQCDSCSGRSLAKIYTGGSTHLREIKKRKQMPDGSVGYFDGSKRLE